MSLRVERGYMETVERREGNIDRMLLYFDF